MNDMENVEMNATVDGSTEDTGRGGDTHTSIAPLSETGLKEKYGKIYKITVTVDEDDENEGRSISFIFKKPSASSFNRYIKNASKDMAKATGIFVRDNVIEEQTAILEKECGVYPGLALGIGQKLLSALGLGDNINFKQL